MNLKIEVLSITPEQVAKRNGFREHVVFKIMATKIPQKAAMAPPTFVCQTKKHGEKQILQEVGNKLVRLSRCRKKGLRILVYRVIGFVQHWEARLEYDRESCIVVEFVNCLEKSLNQFIWVVQGALLHSYVGYIDAAGYYSSDIAHNLISMLCEMSDFG